MGLDTKTYWLTDRQSQCDFDFGDGVVDGVQWRTMEYNGSTTENENGACPSDFLKWAD
jgi:hypothetical protein